MHASLARHFVFAAFRSKRELEDLLEMLETVGDPAECARVKSAIFVITSEIDRFVDLVLVDHPDVKQDIDDKIAIFGEPI